MSDTHILIIEDDVLIAQDIENKLRRAGYQHFESVSTGEQAVSYLKEHLVSLVLMDIHLTGALDGVETAVEIRKSSNIPIIYLTAYSDDNTLSRARLTEPSGFLSKPINDRDLHIAIEIALYKHSIDQRIRESEERFHIISDLTSDLTGVWQVHPDQSVQMEWIGGAVMEITGYHPEELLALGGTPAITHSEDRQIVKDSTNNILAGNQDISEYRILTKSGNIRWLRAYGQIIPSHKPGQNPRFCRAVQDITQRKQQELESLEYQTFLETLNEITKVALEAPDLENLLNSLNPKLMELIHSDDCYLALFDNQHAGTLLAAASTRLLNIYQDDIPSVQEHALIQAIEQSGTPLFIENISTNPLTQLNQPDYPTSGAIIGILLSSGEKHLGILIFYFESSRQFSRIEIEQCQQIARQVSLAIDKVMLLIEATRRANELQTLETVSVALRLAQTRSALVPAILNQVTRLFSASGAAVELYNPATQEMETELSVQAWENWQGTKYAIQAGIGGLVVTRGIPYFNSNTAEEPLPLDLPNLDGIKAVGCVPMKVQDHPIGALWVGRSKRLVPDEQHLLGAIGNIAAVAIHRQTLFEERGEQLHLLESAQTRLLQKEKLAAIGEMIAGVAHELNNPLTSILLYAQLAQEANLNPEIRNELNTIASEATRAAEIVRGLLDFARQRKPERKTTQINDLLQSSLDLVSHELHRNKIEVETNLSNELPAILVDPYQIQQVFVNIINNAWQALSNTHGQRVLQVTSHLSQSKAPELQGKKQTVAQIVFKDNGQGVSQNQLARLFDPFFTTKPETGTGLGLSICHGIITQHNGYIWAESILGEGTSFIIEIPLVLTQPVFKHISTEKFAPISIQSQKKQNSILIIDDESTVLEVLARALKRRNYHVDTASDGNQGLTRAKTGEYDLILCDMRMPGLSGQELYTQIQQTHPDLAHRFIFTTGDTISLSTRQFFEETNVPFLSKPFELKHFLQKVENAINELS